MISFPKPPLRVVGEFRRCKRAPGSAVSWLPVIPEGSRLSSSVPSQGRVP